MVQAMAKRPRTLRARYRWIVQRMHPPNNRGRYAQWETLVFPLHHYSSQAEATRAMQGWFGIGTPETLASAFRTLRVVALR
jgi:hypothetical protein